MKIESLYRKNKSYGEIADELDLSIIEVMEYLQQIKSDKSTETVITDRKTMVKRLYEEGKTLEEIANNLNISDALVKEDLLSFGIIPGITKRRVKGKEEESPNKQEMEVGERVKKEEEFGNISKSHILGIKERREKVEKLYDEGIEEEEIASRLGVSVRVVIRDIEALLDARMIQDKSSKAKIDDNIEKEEEEAKILKRREQIERLYKQGKSAKEIAEELGISVLIVKNDINILVKRKIIERRVEKENGGDDVRKEDDEKRREEVERLYNEGITVTEIVQRLNVSRDKIYRRHRCIRKGGKN